MFQKHGAVSRPLTDIFTNDSEIDRRNLSRTVPMKVLCLGLGRTGTASLRVALKQLGFQDTYHMLSASTENPLDCLLWSEALAAKYDGTGERFGRAKWDALLGHCQAVCDWPAASFADELIEAYPDAKVVLTTRDVDSWYKPTKATVNWRAQHDYMLWALSYVDWDTGIRIVDFYQIASFQTCIALHLRYLRPELSPAELAHHVGLAQGMFTTAQIASAPLWGSAADRIGRKAVVLIGLVGTALSCIGVAFAGSVSSIILWRLFAGAVNGTVMAARAAVSDNLALEHRPAGFSLLVLSFHVANVLGPVVTAMSMGSGASQRPVSPSESVQLGTSSWITNNPFAAPNILSAILLVGDAALVWLKLQEVHQKDYGKWQSWLFGRSNSHYRKLPDVNSGNTSSMRLEAIEEGQRHTTERSDSIWTPKFIVVLSTVCILEFHLGAFGSLWPLFVVVARRNADDPVKMPFIFTGGLQLKDADLGWAVGALGAIGVLLQLTAVPHVTVKYGAVRAFKASLPLFPLSLFLAPYLALVPAGHAWILWFGIFSVLFFHVVGRSFGILVSILLVNQSTAQASRRGTVHGIANAVANTSRSLGAIAGGYLFGIGLQHSTVGFSWWIVCCLSLLSWALGRWL
ncbi:putative membrane protein [Colletotrichum orbiculare MAFF 240422]|uniref:Membrane protein n=1 Tax=Colletotrichum orbiculare (strain 104-T / ATCC 96160 / CBS 514.97 / LARS 414 / MAFF 240422) TaxID=1213857 RepID=A0A484FH05_COLOR|nr:putative membrane protein [Colletotrichum orbiculare MAFF 240422]